ncbi:MAG: hypothetical protein DPW13_11895 [Planctomycetes bacterium]|nr:hypothetical protein [Planctomycetota bacterium]
MQANAYKLQPQPRAMQRKRIVIIEKKPRKTFGEKLEEQARAMLSDRPRDEPAGTLDGIVDNELALTLDQVTRFRDLHATLERRLLLLECYVDTEIIQRSPRGPFYYDPYWHDRQMLRWRLFRIEDERRRLALQRDETLRPLHDRLLALLHRRKLLRGDTFPANRDERKTWRRSDR